ncbi:hypothetical protein LTR53_006686 [Teratosphaeriaceae sp. CCFEE 6253]|nr:hypothetical protein LTR53_006686 [Teratosphaeriaceae sp. CCFEE 6253]
MAEVDRRTLLSGKAMPGAQKKIYDRNAETSPLLRLPPELRNRIWHLLLGGQVVHITTRERRQRFGWLMSRLPPVIAPALSGLIIHATTCLHRDRHERWVARAKAAQEAREVIVPYGQAHALCEIQPPDPDASLSIAVLQVCRQIHQDAALLPFLGNEFTFDGAGALLRFTRHILLPQSRSLRRVTLVLRNTDPAHLRNVHRLMGSKLQGVRDLTLLLESLDTRPKAITIKRFRGQVLALRSLRVDVLGVVGYVVLPGNPMPEDFDWEFGVSSIWPLDRANLDLVRGAQTTALKLLGTIVR